VTCSLLGGLASSLPALALLKALWGGIEPLSGRLVTVLIGFAKPGQRL
jgi:hypothetical protein